VHCNAMLDLSHRVHVATPKHCNAMHGTPIGVPRDSPTTTASTATTAAAPRRCPGPSLLVSERFLAGSLWTGQDEVGPRTRKISSLKHVLHYARLSCSLALPQGCTQQDPKLVLEIPAVPFRA